MRFLAATVIDSMTRPAVKGYTKRAVTRLKFKKWCDGNAALRQRKVELYDAWLEKQSTEYQWEKRSKMYDPMWNGGVRHARTKDQWRREWYNSGTPVEWVYFLETHSGDGPHPWER